MLYLKIKHKKGRQENMKTKKIISTLIISIFLLNLLTLVGCNNKIDEPNLDKKPIINVSIAPEKTMVEAVCGDLADVVILIPPGSNPENYAPTPLKMENFSKASLYFSIGVPTEEANILPNIGDVKVVSLADEVNAVYDDRSFESGQRDPHIWLSPKRVSVMIDVIAREMGEIDSKNKETYTNNANAYQTQLNALDQEIKEMLNGVENKKFIVYHPAFGYIADDYGLEMYALEKDGKESTPQYLQEMIDLAKKENIKVIFYQEEIDGSQSEAFAEEINGKTIQLSPLAADYISNFKNMVNTIAEVMK
jgi:zinc transport system substrate-binding protein